MLKHSAQCIYTMDLPSTFHPGRRPNLIRKDTRNRQRRRNQPDSSEPFWLRPVWRILPCDSQVTFLIDTLHGNTLLEKQKSLEAFGSSLQTTCSLFPTYTPNPTFLQTIRRLKYAAHAKMLENQRIRWTFKRFLSRWRLRHFKQINDIDYITLSPIEKPVHLHNFPTRTIYTFESASILCDIHKKLLHHCGQIPNPLFPRNPYTNQPFTLSQVLSIHQQCKQFGHTSWCLEAFCRSKVSVSTFLQVQRKALRIHALKTILYDSSEYEGLVLLLNFIESQHEHHTAPFNKPLYRWCILRLEEDPTIQQWRSFCKEYYEQDILAEDDTSRDECFFHIAQKTGTFCAPPHDLLAKRNLLAHRK